jgi:SNF2 family DNA or RNA helicase
MSVEWIPHPYQEKAIKFFLERSCGALFSTPGSGKTTVALAVVKLLKQVGMKALIIAPLRPTYMVWPNEIAKWTNFREFSFGILHGKDKNDVLEEDHDIYLMNYDSVPWFSTKKFSKFPFDILICDELHKVKNIRTQRFKLLKSSLPRFKRRYGLTGSPCSNSLLDLFGQAYAMDLGRALGQYITHYRLNYFIQVDPYTWLPQPGAEEKIFSAVAPLALRLDVNDYLQLPPLVETNIRVKLPTSAAKVYKQMEEILRLDFLAGRVVAANSGVASAKCRQIANGHVYLDDGTAENIHDAKLEALRDIIDELQGAPLMVCYEFKADAHRIANFLGYDVPSISGETSMAESKDIEARWNKGEIPVLLGQSRSISLGLNLQGFGSAVAFFSLPTSFEVYEQCIARVWRQGQKNRVFVYRLMAENTIDFAALKSLQKKEKTQNNFFEALQEYWGETCS